MKRALLAVLIGAALLASPMAHSNAARQAECISRAAVPVPLAYASTVARARALVCDKLAARISGLQVAVGVDGKLVWSEGFGYADVARKIPVTAETQFRIGSVSKPITAAAVALLYEQGKLDLDAPVQRYVPSFPDKGVPITTRQLAGHLAGIRHYRGDEFLLNRRFASVLADRVDSLIPNRTRFYERAADGAFVLAPPVDNSYKWAGGGFVSTAEDLVKFGSAMLRPGFLKAGTLELLFTSQKTTAGEPTGYGVGWFVGTDSLGHRWVFHGGSSVGGTTAFGVDRDSRVVVAITSNLSDAPLAPGEGIRALFDR